MTARSLQLSIFCKISVFESTPFHYIQARSQLFDNGGSFSSDFGPLSGFENWSCLWMKYRLMTLLCGQSRIYCTW